MNRRDFLITIACASAVISTGCEFSEENKSFLLEFAVAGYRYYNGVQYEAFIKEGERIHLIREPDNRHDNNAVAVYLKHIKLGYVPKADNRVIANLMDSGSIITGIITDFNGDNPSWDRVRVHLFLG